MTRILRSALLAAVLLTAGLATSAHAATWTPVAGVVPAEVTSAAADGPRTLAASTSRSGQHVVITTIAGGRVTRSQTIRGLGTVRHLQVAALPGGRALAVWQGRNAVLSSLRPSPGARFGPAQVVSVFPGVTTGAARLPDLAVTTTGEPVVAWWGGPSGGRIGIQASSMAPDGTWGAPVDITAGTYANWPPGFGFPDPHFDIAADPAGGVVAAWRGDDVILLGVLMMGAVRSPSGEWGPVATLGLRGGYDAGVRLDLPAVAAPAPGVLVAAWIDLSLRRRPSAGCVTSATLRGSMVTPADVVCPSSGPPGEVRVAPAPGGVVLATRVEPMPSGGSAAGQSLGVQDVAALRSPGTWTGVRRAVARESLTTGLAPTTRGRTAMLTVLYSRAGLDGVRVALIEPDGTVSSRIGGPARPAIPRSARVRLLPLGPGARVALLVVPRTFTGRSGARASILTIGP
ncbi:MAG: hypothetical protein AB7V62_06130 [Thermoleophilia bacterium]